MSKLEELIARLCPDGVEYKTTNDVKITSFWLMPATPKFTDKGVEYITSKNIKSSRIDFNDTKYISFEAYQKISKNREIQQGDLLVTMIGTIGEAAFVNEDRLFYGQNLYLIRLDENKIDRKYYYYYLTMPRIKDGLVSKKNASSQGYIKAGSLDSLKLPVPPLEVQREIVHILDSFTLLTAELTAELAARQKQYEFYRDALLTFKNIDDTILNERTNELELSGVVRWMKLGDIGPVCMCKRILKSETNSQSGVPFYKIGTFGKEADAYISHEKFSEYKAKYNFPKKGDVLISAAGTIGRTVIYDGKPAYFQDSNIVWIDNDETQVTNAFLKYYYSMKPWKSSDGGTISRLYNDDIRKTPVPVPPLSEQQRIVDILDRFDALCNDITSGLPAEIEARKKQYEYYRDKLLTFKELKKEA